MGANQGMRGLMHGLTNTLTGMTEFSRAEAIDVLAQCALMEDSIRALRIKARRALKPELKLVEVMDDRNNSNSSSRVYPRPISG